MSEPIQLRTVNIKGSFMAKYSTSIGGVSKITMTTQCGEPARVDLECGGPNPTKKDVNIISGGTQLKAVLDANKEFQKDLFSGTDSEYTIIIETKSLIGEGGDGEVTFNGVLSSPGFSIAPGSFAASCSLVHEDVLMESIDPTIYLRQANVMGTTEEVLATKLNLAFEKDFLTSVRKQPLNKHIELLIKSSIDNSKMTWGANKDPNRQGANVKKNFDDSDDVCEEIHKHNKATSGLEIAKEFLKRSEDTALQDKSGDLSEEVLLFDGKEIHENAADPSSYANWLCGAYGTSRNFYNFIMQTITPNFLLEYTCQFDGDSKIGHPQVDSKNPQLKKLQITSFSFNLGSRFQRALGMVICNGGSNFITGAHEVGNSSVDMGCYPQTPNPDNGKLIHTEGPPWFTPLGRFTKKKEHHPDADDEADPNARVPKAQGEDDSEKAKDARDDAMAESKPVEFLKLWAEKQYRLWCLKNTTATIHMPLDLEWGVKDGNPIGKRYTVKPKDSGQETSGILFSGYLNRVQHTASVGSNVGNATTILDFTHIKCDGVTLGGLNP